MTGLDIKNIFETKIDKTYSAFYNTTKLNALFKEALVNTIEQIYKGLDEQKEYDEIVSLIKTETAVNPVANKVQLFTLITDYWHLLAVKAKYEQATSYAITGATYTTPIVITVDKRNTLRTGDLVNISGVLGNIGTGNVGANGERYLKRIRYDKFQLYADETLLTPIAGGGGYLSGGTIGKVYYNYCKPLFSDRKISTFIKPSPVKPFFQMDNKNMTFYPLTPSCSQVKVDYIIKPPVIINVADNVIDLEVTYPIKLLYSIANEAANLFSENIKDQELFQTTNYEKQVNL